MKMEQRILEVIEELNNIDMVDYDIPSKYKNALDLIKTYKKFDLEKHLANEILEYIFYWYGILDIIDDNYDALEESLEDALFFLEENEYM